MLPILLQIMSLRSAVAFAPQRQSSIKPIQQPIRQQPIQPLCMAGKGNGEGGDVEWAKALMAGGGTELGPPRSQQGTGHVN